MKRILLIILFCCSYSRILCQTCKENSTIQQENGYQKITSYKPGDYIIQSLQSITDGGACDRVTIGGLLRTYAVKFAIESANQNSNILPNTTLGWKINDACLSLPITMAHGIELSNSYRYSECPAHSKNDCDSQLAIKPAVAIVGAYYSFNSLPLATLLSLYDVPQISFGASSPLFNKKSVYPSFFRTIPSDASQVQAMIDFLVRFNWTYVFAVGSEDNYGKLAIAEFKNRVLSRGICVTGDVYIPFETDSTKTIAKEIALKIKSEPKATVVIMFNYALEMGEYILNEAEKLNISRIWLTSEAWNPEVLGANIPSNQLESIISVSLKTGNDLPEFVQYLCETVSYESTCDVWLKEYLKVHFNCSVKERRGEQLIGEFCVGLNCSDCSVSIKQIINDMLNDNPGQINLLIDAVDSLIYALDNLTMARCPNKTNCAPTVLPKELTEAMKNVHFVTRQNHTFEFDEFGNPTFFDYSIEQIIYNKTLNQHQYVSIGHWFKENSFLVSCDSISWPDWSNNTKPRSSCSIDCQLGEFVVGKRECCWDCQPCPTNMVSEEINAVRCKECPVGYHTVDSRHCIETPIHHFGFLDASGLTIFLVNILGVILTLVAFSLFMFFKLFSYRIENSQNFIYLSIFVLLLTFLYPIIRLVEPTHERCVIQAVYFHGLLSVYSASVLVMNTSISHFLAKIMQRKENSSFINASIFLSVQIIEVVLLGVWIYFDNVSTSFIDNETNIFKQCKLSFTPMRTAVFAWPSFVLLAATVQSLSERNNFTSSYGKYVRFASYFLCIITVAYIVTVNYVIGEYQGLVILLVVSAYGFSYLSCMVFTTLFTIWKTPNEVQVNGVLNIGFQSTSFNNIEKVTRT